MLARPLLPNVPFEFLKGTLELSLSMVFLVVPGQVETIEMQSVVKAQLGTMHKKLIKFQFNFYVSDPLKINANPNVW